jgi:hypothetical protein
MKSNNMQRVNSGWTGFWARLLEVSSSLCLADIIVFALILGFGALQFFCCQPMKEFNGDEVFYGDAARSLIQHGFYGINGYAETNLPPGLSSIFALLCLAGGYSHAVFLRTLAVFGTLAFLVSYELLRRQVPRIVAAGICLLLISSRVHFQTVTGTINPCYPYFFTTISAFLVARKLESASRLGPRIAWAALLTALIAASMMFNSAGMALLGAIVAYVGVAFFRDRALAVVRLKTYILVFLIGIGVQGLWTHRGSIEASAGIAAQEWPVLGFPHSYVEQLKVKDGHYPELGVATPFDFVIRVLNNASERADMLSRMLLRRLPQLAWMSIFVAGPLLLVALGWFRSVWPRGGGLLEWYFAGYEFIYLLWPWSLESRFFLPVAPLACLYLWRGGSGLVALAKEKPRVVGVLWLPIGVFLAATCWFWMRGTGPTGHYPNSGLEDELSFAIWSLSTIFAAWMVWPNDAWLTSAAAFGRWSLRPIGRLRVSLLRVTQLLGIAVVGALVVVGLMMQLEMGRDNLNPNSASNRLSSDGRAALWINSHTDTNAVVMARQVPIVYHYSNRKVVWFPPSSDSQLLMDGIVRNKVNFVMVVRREEDYYLPPDEVCFAPLILAYPQNLRLVFTDPDIRIFQVGNGAPPPVPNRSHTRG